MPTPDLTPEAFAQARAFLEEQGRPLDRARFRHAFGGAQPTEVLAALRAYQNQDGGFGQALEPDCRAPHSSVLATMMALRVLHELEVPTDEPLLTEAMEWLHTQLHTDLDGSVWPFLPPQAEAFPHAPWWNQSEPGELARTFAGFRVNPRAELVARLWAWPGLLPEGLRAQLTLEARDAVLAGLEKGDVNSHAAAAVFAGTLEIPDDHRLPVLEYLADVLPDRVQTSPEEFAQYGLNPLMVAPTPDHPLAHGLEEPISAALLHLITALAGDGSWGPDWSWFGQFPDAWPTAESEWRSALTMDALLTLKAWGRLK
ncbi:hypothetical protein [Deinococcus humi]|uniref:Prenyltransferase n=1 Tax=Deinococcus humi TaxID=662880 RepID=A0A7W8JZQ1_9DEIO|nr:hypothetical protein [Deinococcus humi]MBB5364923.1 hypothetical protein [Deinococcus humi]GGO33638.1 hypothetical protein GCM10008949_33120 [Deinococcus humi]